MKILLAFFIGTIAAIGAWFGYDKTAMAPAPQTHEVAKNADESNHDTASGTITQAHLVCNPAESKECPPLSDVDAGRQSKALEIIANAKVLDETESTPFLIDSDARYEVMKNLSYGGGVVYRVVDINAQAITDSFSGSHFGYDDRYFYFNRVSVGTINAPAYADSLGMYVIGTPKVVYFENSVLPQNQTYASDLARAPAGPAIKPIARADDSITLAVYDMNGKAIGQRTFVFSQAH